MRVTGTTKTTLGCACISATSAASSPSGRSTSRTGTSALGPNLSKTWFCTRSSTRSGLSVMTTRFSRLVPSKLMKLAASLRKSFSSDAVE